MLLSIFTPALAKNNDHLFFRAVSQTDAEIQSDASCQAPWPQNNQQPSAPHQLPQPSVRSCNPSDDNLILYGVELHHETRLYVDALIELLLDALESDASESESDHGDHIVACKKRNKAGCRTSVHICVHRARSRSPRRQVGEPHAAANPHAESHPGLAPAESDGKDGKD